MKTSELMDEEDGAWDDGSELFPPSPLEGMKKSFDFRFVLDIFWITFAAFLLVKFFNVY